MKFLNEFISENTLNSELFQQMSLLSIMSNKLKTMTIVELFSKHASKKIYI